MRILTLTTLAVLITPQASLVAGQRRQWKVHLSPDKTFSVIVPEVSASIEPPDDKNRGCSLGERGLDFALEETIPRTSRFGIIVINGNAKILGFVTRQKARKHLSWYFIAEEDEAQFLRTPAKVQTRGLIGREYFYIRRSETPLFVRGRILDTGKRIYIMVFRGRDATDLESVEANLFFNSFQLHRSRVSGQKKRPEPPRWSLRMS